MTHATAETPRTVPFCVVRSSETAPCDQLVIVLHGLQQRAADVAESLEPAVRPGQVLLVPEGLSRSLPRPLAPRAGASWSTGEDAEIDLRDNLRWLDAARERHVAALSPRAVDLVGFSQGGLMAARWLAARAHPWRRVVLWASLLPDDAAPGRVARGLGEAELVVALGDADPFVRDAVRQVARARLDALGRPWRAHPFAGGHEMPPDVFREVLT